MFYMGEQGMWHQLCQFVKAQGPPLTGHRCYLSTALRSQILGVEEVSKGLISSL